MQEFFLHKENGQIANMVPFYKAVEHLPDGWIKTTTKSAKKRTNKQNRFYWLLLTDYIQPGLYDLGYREIKRKEDAHAFCSNEFLKRPVINELTGEVKYHVRSTSELTTIEWEEYREDLNQFASEYLGITLPDPNEQLTITY